MGVKTALYASHVALGARMVDFGGWEMPVQYEGALAEHGRVRADVGIFDTGHMDAFLIEGPDSLETLSRIVTQDLRSLAVGACRYGFMLNESGGVLDDLIVYRLGETSWMPVVNAATAPGDFAWILGQCEGTRTVARDLRDAQAKLDVQGPGTLGVLRRVLGLDLTGLKRFRWQRIDAGPAAGWLVSRTGYTGEDGVEIYASPEATVAAWEALLAAGARPCGLGARDTLRLEAGLPLYGHELSLAVSPAEARLLRHCSKSEPFIGRDALRERAAAPQWLLTPFRLDGRQAARNGHLARLEGGEEIGCVTSGAFAPSLGRAIGFAYVLPPYSHPGQRWFVDTGRAMLPATAAALPFLGERKSEG